MLPSFLQDLQVIVLEELRGPSGPGFEACIAKDPAYRSSRSPDKKPVGGY
jgi:hypothetical protein